MEIGAVVAVLAALQLIMVNRYGPHRDELYFVAAGQHLAWGYPDQPLFTPLLARLATELAPHNLLALRLPSIIAVALLVICAAAFARLLGGGRAAQVLTASTVAASVITVTLGHRLSTATFDTLAWTAVLLVVGYALRDDRPRLWLLAGLLAGLGLNNKTAVVVLLFAILVGVLLVPTCRTQLRTPYPWLGGLIAILLWLPNLVWQVMNGWPVLALGADIAEEFGGVAGRLVCWRWRWHVLPGDCHCLDLRSGSAVSRAGLGEAAADRCGLSGGNCRLSHRRRKGLLPGGSDRAACCSRLHGTCLTLVCSPTHCAGVVWPCPPPSPGRPSCRCCRSARTPPPSIPRWTPISSKRSVGRSSRARSGPRWTHCRLTSRTRAVVFTRNYGEAGALEWYGLGRPVFSGHNAFGDWGPPPEGAGPVIVIGLADPGANFTDCHIAAMINNDADADNEERGRPIWVCSAPQGGWAEQWPRLVHLDA